MDRGLERVTSGVWAVVEEVRREDVTFMAASIAYHAFVSMLPVLLLLILVVSAVGGERFGDTVVALTTALLPATARQIVADALQNATAGVGLSVVGVGVLLWGTSKIFRAMDAAFAEIYDTERELSLLDQFRDALVVVLALAAAVAGAVVLGSVVAVPATVPLASLLNGLLAVLGLSVALFPIYYVFPNVDVAVREVIPGVLVAAVGWVALKRLFDLYVSFSAKPDLYGLVGTLVLLVTWLYVGGLVVLVGAAVNATLAGRGGRRTAGDKRRFGRAVMDAGSFEGRLRELVGEARDADVPEEDVRRVLRRQVAASESDGGDRRATDETDEESGSDPER